MAEDPKNEVEESVTPPAEVKPAKKKKGVLSRLWNALFRVRGDDFEKRLQHISKEEATILARIARRSLNWRRMVQQLILFSVLLEVIAVGYAIMTTRSLHMNWKMRALRVLPMFLLPVLSSLTYSALKGYKNMREKKDQSKLESLRAELKEKIHELKERTNYYITQQLIQRYDPDPAAKAAAATVLASKLGADSGLKVHLGEDIDHGNPTGHSNDMELARTDGLRNRKQPRSKSRSMDNIPTRHTEEAMLSQVGFEGGSEVYEQRELIVEHGPQAGLGVNDGGWIARLAALLVGEDPAHSYALICGNCHMHNGLARKEDFPFITYYCPHCKALNTQKQSSELTTGTNTPATITSLPSVEEEVAMPSTGGVSTDESVSPTNAPATPATDIVKESEN